MQLCIAIYNLYGLKLYQQIVNEDTGEPQHAQEIKIKLKSDFQKEESYF